MTPPRHSAVAAARGRVAAATWTRIAPASPPPSGCASRCVAEPHEQRSAERLAIDDLKALSGSDPALGQIPEHLRVGVRDPHERPACAAVHLLQRLRVPLDDLQVPGRDRITVRVVGGVAELRGDQLLELLGEHVLEHLGLGVNAIPRHPEALHQVQLEQPVVPNHLERHAPSRVGQRHPAVGDVLHVPELAHPLDHRRRRAGRDPEAFGQRVVADRLRGADLERVDRLRVVLDSGRSDRFGAGHTRHAALIMARQTFLLCDVEPSLWQR